MLRGVKVNLVMIKNKIYLIYLVFLYKTILKFTTDLNFVLNLELVSCNFN